MAGCHWRQEGKAGTGRGYQVLSSIHSKEPGELISALPGNRTPSVYDPALYPISLRFPLFHSRKERRVHRNRDGTSFFLFLFSFKRWPYRAHIQPSDSIFEGWNPEFVSPPGRLRDGCSATLTTRITFLLILYKFYYRMAVIIPLFLCVNDKLPRTLTRKHQLARLPEFLPHRNLVLFIFSVFGALFATIFDSIETSFICDVRRRDLFCFFILDFSSFHLSLFIWLFDSVPSTSFLS